MRLTYPRLRLRTLLIAVAVAALALGGWLSVQERNRFRRAWRNWEFAGTVSRVGLTGGRIEVNVGWGNGLKVGDVMELIHLEDDKSFSKSDQSLPIPLGRVRIESTSEFRAVGHVFDVGWGKAINPGDWCFGARRSVSSP